jgi:hypothetical protein
MPATLFHKITESFAGTLFVGHSEGELLYLEQVALRSTTPQQLIDSMVQALADMKQLSGNTVAAPSHVVRFMGQIGIVTPYFEAVPLRLLLDAAFKGRAVFPVAVATKIALDVFDGLCQYHALDAKLCGGICPDHLLVGTDGDTRVGNVAVAAITPKESPWRGKVERLAYLAPEQVTASRGYDARTDVYAIGIILWEMLANRSKMVGSPVQILESLRNAKGAPVLLPLDESKVSRGVIDTLSRALHPNPAERQSSVGALARELLEAGQEPAAASEVAAFVEEAAKLSLHDLRTAIALQQIETLKQKHTPKSGALPKLDSISKPSPAKSETEGPSPAKGETEGANPTKSETEGPSPAKSATEGPSLTKVAPTKPPRPSPKPAVAKPEYNLPNSDRTAVFKVTAELLEKARRGVTNSDPPPPATTSVLAEEYLSSERTVTFEVPEDLLEEARRLFEATEQAAGAPEERITAPPSSRGNLEKFKSEAPLPSFALDETEGRTVDRQHSEALFLKLRSEGPSRPAPTNPPNAQYDEDATTIWRPPPTSEPAKLATPVVSAPPTVTPSNPTPSLATPPPATSPRAAPTRPAYWLLGLIFCVVLSAVAIIVRRVAGH